MLILFCLDAIIIIHILRIIFVAHARFASYTFIKNFLKKTTLLVKPIYNTTWHTRLSQHNVDYSSYIVVLIVVVIRSSLGHIIHYADFQLSHIPIVLMANTIITISRTCFFVAIVLIAECLASLFAYTKSATTLLHSLILPLLYAIRIEPSLSQSQLMRVATLASAGALLFVALALRYVSAWLLLL